MSLVIVTSYNEDGMRVGVESLFYYCPRFSSAYLPMPSELKHFVVLYSLGSISRDDLLQLVQALVPGFRAWIEVNGVLIEGVRYLMREHPHLNIVFYESVEHERRGYERMTVLLSELIRYSISSKVRTHVVLSCVESMLRSRERVAKLISESARDNSIVLLTSYATFHLLRKLMRDRADYLFVHPVIPTPLELLVILRAEGRLDEGAVLECVRYLREYVDYVMCSTSLSAAYMMLLRNESYRRFLGRIIATLAAS